jgi:hypothetical protein
MVSGTDKTTRFILGVLMLAGGTYMFLSSVHVSFGMNYPLYRVGNFNLTSGFIFIPFMFGVGMIFYDSRNLLGWILAVGSLAALIMGVVSSTQMYLRSMNAFQLITILVLMIGGLGLFLSSLRGGGN